MEFCYDVLLVKCTWKNLKLCKKVFRIVAKEAYNSHTAPLFSRLSILKLVYIYNINMGKYIYCCAHHILPEPINLTNLPNEQIHHHNTRSKHSVHIEPPGTKLSANSFIHSGPEYWNKLPEHVKTESSIFSISRRLKEYLIERYQSDTEA